MLAQEEAEEIQIAVEFLPGQPWGRGEGRRVAATLWNGSDAFVEPLLLPWPLRNQTAVTTKANLLATSTPRPGWPEERTVVAERQPCNLGLIAPETAVDFYIEGMREYRHDQLEKKNWSKHNSVELLWLPR